MRNKDMFSGVWGGGGGVVGLLERMAVGGKRGDRDKCYGTDAYYF